MTLTETVIYLKYLGSLFPTFQWQAETPAAWHNAGLCFVSPDHAKAAALALVRRSAFVALADLLT
ncbi:hypothetical protein HII36_55045, partial [Nonomuraea sp. NN258]|uniref:hypothetical protein n=1 Tax=Nonomuraea antri TaxID=2730852 RepID=UPI001567EE6C